MEDGLLTALHLMSAQEPKSPGAIGTKWVCKIIGEGHGVLDLGIRNWASPWCQAQGPTQKLKEEECLRLVPLLSTCSTKILG